VSGFWLLFWPTLSAAFVAVYLRRHGTGYGPSLAYGAFWWAVVLVLELGVATV
jgi:hypothetical protein